MAPEHIAPSQFSEPECTKMTTPAPLFDPRSGTDGESTASVSTHQANSSPNVRPVGDQCLEQYISFTSSNEAVLEGPNIAQPTCGSSSNPSVDR